MLQRMLPMSYNRRSTVICRAAIFGGVRVSTAPQNKGHSSTAEVKCSGGPLRFCSAQWAGSDHKLHKAGPGGLLPRPRRWSGPGAQAAATGGQHKAHNPPNVAVCGCACERRRAAAHAAVRCPTWVCERCWEGSETPPGPTRMAAADVSAMGPCSIRRMRHLSAQRHGDCARSLGGEAGRSVHMLQA